MRSARGTIIASNRGPVSFERDETGTLVPKRGGGGLVTALTAVLQQTGGLWVASAITAEDREQAERGRLEVATEGLPYDVRYLAFPAHIFDRYYNGVSNRILWFVHHYLWDVPRTPQFGATHRRDWNAYRSINARFAEALHEEAGRSRSSAFLVQDYHLAFVPAMLRERRPDARISHFSHIPFAGPTYLKILPTYMREELLSGLLGADVVGFQAEPWAQNFLLCCRLLPGAKVDVRRREVRWDGRRVRVAVYPISIDAAAMEATAGTPEVARAVRRLGRWRGDARLIVRVDRTELSKNILRGFLAYETFLRRNSRWRRRVRFLALFNSSRGSIVEYRQYMKECLRVAGRINAELGERGWQPIRVAVGDDFPTVMAAYSLYDVLMVNPVYDGMNLVAKEGPLLNRQDGVLILSENAGAVAELGRHALCVNPFDVAETADAIAEALEMGHGDRARRAAALREAVQHNTAERWISAQLDDLDARSRRR